jgi:hypothetical protein
LGVGTGAAGECARGEDGHEGERNAPHALVNRRPT